jgi:hypothetical protein
MHIMIMKYPASLCSMREYNFLLILWSRNIHQTFVRWRIWFFMHIMIMKYPANLCSMREYNFLLILWSRDILQVFVQWENTIFYASYDHGISCKSLFKERIWFFMHIMVKIYSASLCSMREYGCLCVWWCSNILQVFVPWENMVVYAYDDAAIFCKSLFNERIWFFMHSMIEEYSASLCSMREYAFLCMLWSRNILQVFVPWENMIFYAYYD